MATPIYKPDQGYWTRFMSTIAIGVLGLAGAAWLWQQLSVFNNRYIQLGAVVGLMLVLAALTYWAYGVHRKSVEFFIATEGEMKKVNWSSRREVLGNTWVVIIVSVAISVILFVTDLLFSQIFTWVGVLRGGG